VDRVPGMQARASRIGEPERAPSDSRAV
jgi:hypothetical protein